MCDLCLILYVCFIRVWFAGVLCLGVCVVYVCTQMYVVSIAHCVSLVSLVCVVCVVSVVVLLSVVSCVYCV